MKKFLIGFICLIGAVGCACQGDKASDAVEKYLNNYKGLSDQVLSDIDDIVNKEELEDKQKDAYREVMKRQYKDMTYTILDESYNGDDANVTVKITVYDLYKVDKDATDYLNNHKDEFLTEGNYDKKKYLDYRLEQMKNMKDTVSYNIVFKVDKTNGKWQVEQPDEVTLEKIHGIYNYKAD